MKKQRKTLIWMIIVFIIVIITVILVLTKKSGEVEKVGKDESNETNITEVTKVAKATEEKYVEVLENGSKLNTSEELHKEKEVSGLVLTGINLQETGGITKLTAQVQNNTGSAVEEKMISIEVLNKQGGKITTLKGIIGKMEVGGTAVLDISVTRDISDAYDFRIVE